MDEGEQYWDHTGEDLECTSLLGSFRADSALFREKRIDDVEDDLLQLLDHLEDTTYMLQDYIEGLRARDNKVENNTESATTCFPARCRCPCSCKKLLDKVTGTKTIIFTVILQGLNLLIQTIIDVWPRRDEYTFLVVSGFSMILLQLFNLILIIISSVKLASEMYHNRRVSGILLLQSYCAAILLFAGIYTVTRRLKTDSWKYLKEDVADDPVLIVVLYSNFLFFSVSTATLCGSSDLSPHEWYNYILVSIQMLLSFMYFASIMGHCLPALNDDSRDRRREALNRVSIRQSIRRNSSFASRPNSRGATSQLSRPSSRGANSQISRPNSRGANIQNYGSTST